MSRRFNASLDVGLYRIQNSPAITPVPRIVEGLNRFRPHYLSGFPSMLGLRSSSRPPVSEAEDGQSSTSSPSYPTSTPALSTASRSGERSSSTGFVLLMWTRIARGRLSRASASSVPPGPESGT